MELGQFIQNLNAQAQALASAGGRESERVGGLEQTARLCVVQGLTQWQGAGRDTAEMASNSLAGKNVVPEGPTNKTSFSTVSASVMLPGAQALQSLHEQVRKFSQMVSTGKWREPDAPFVVQPPAPISTDRYADTEKRHAAVEYSAAHGDGVRVSKQRRLQTQSDDDEATQLIVTRSSLRPCVEQPGVLVFGRGVDHEGSRTPSQNGQSNLQASVVRFVDAIFSSTATRNGPQWSAGQPGALAASIGQRLPRGLLRHQTGVAVDVGTMRRREGQVVRFAKYLNGDYRMLVELFPFGGDHGVFHAISDFDSGLCLKARKSTSAGVLLVGQCMIKHWSGTHTAITLSSAEVELSAARSAIREGKGLKSPRRILR